MFCIKKCKKCSRYYGTFRKDALCADCELDTGTETSKTMEAFVSTTHEVTVKDKLGELTFIVSEKGLEEVLCKEPKWAKPKSSRDDVTYVVKFILTHSVAFERAKELLNQLFNSTSGEYIRIEEHGQED